MVVQLKTVAKISFVLVSFYVASMIHTDTDTTLLNKMRDGMTFERITKPQ